MTLGLDALRLARDTAQQDYAHIKQRCLMGSASQRQRDTARAAYMLAQSQYRDALIASKRSR